MGLFGTTGDSLSVKTLNGLVVIHIGLTLTNAVKVESALIEVFIDVLLKVFDFFRVNKLNNSRSRAGIYRIPLGLKTKRLYRAELVLKSVNSELKRTSFVEKPVGKVHVLFPQFRYEIIRWIEEEVQ